MAKQKSHDQVKVERRKSQEQRESGEHRQRKQSVAVERRTEERRKVPRRRQIDPTTCERDYTSEEIEFMRALDDYKRASGRMFPTCSEILEVVKAMGYQRVSQASPPDQPTSVVSDAALPESVEATSD